MFSNNKTKAGEQHHDKTEHNQRLVLLARRFPQNTCAMKKPDLNATEINNSLAQSMKRLVGFKMHSFGFLFYAVTFVQAKEINLLEDSHFNLQASCEDYHYDGMRLPFAEVVIGGKVFDKMNCGEMVPLDVVTKDVPVVKFSQDNETLYLVAMLDPDTPSFFRPLCRHWVHFIFGNVKGKYLAYGKIRGGNIYGEYNPPNPQPGQGIHRFYFFVFEQKRKLVDGIHIANRCGFNIDGFMRDFDLRPVAMNMFRSEFQDGVLISEIMMI